MPGEGGISSAETIQEAAFPKTVLLLEERRPALHGRRAHAQCGGSNRSIRGRSRLALSHLRSASAGLDSRTHRDRRRSFWRTPGRCNKRGVEGKQQTAALRPIIASCRHRPYQSPVSPSSSLKPSPTQMLLEFRDVGPFWPDGQTSALEDGRHCEISTYGLPQVLLKLTDFWCFFREVLLIVSSSLGKHDLTWIPGLC